MKFETRPRWRRDRERCIRREPPEAGREGRGHPQFLSRVGAEKYGSRFQRVVKQTEQAHEKHGYNVSTSGHSLGGRASSYTTEKLGDRDWYEGGTGLNPGVSSVGGGMYYSKSRRACRSKKPPKWCSKQTSLVQEGDYVGGRNIGCAVLTMGMGGKMCRKSTGFGKTKYYQHTKKPRLLPTFFHNGKNHSLDNFKKGQQE